VSDFRAIATVTEALRTRLQFEANGEGFPGNVGTLESPDTMGKASTTPAINVFLYQVSPNAALRNADLPTRDSAGSVRQRPRAALDLHYIISTYGTGFEPQFLLGIVVRSLHSTPFLTRKEINDASIATKSAFGSEVDTVKFVPASISLDELSKIWSVFFQTKYALSTTYQASVVFIEGKEAATPALPVRAPHLRVLPTLGPVIDRVAPGPTFVVGDTLQILGQNLRGDGTRVRLGDALVATPAAENDVITVLLNEPPLAAGVLRAGISAVRVIQDVDFGLPSGMRHAFESNVVPFVLAPKITAPLVFTPAPVPNPPPIILPKVTVTVVPDVAAGQRLTLMLTEIPGGLGHLFTFTTTAATTGAAQDINVPNIVAGTYLVRVQVDGASSALDVDAGGNYISPTLTVPP
jgi:hypothetical protein